jgi:hypothetical protein
LSPQLANYLSPYVLASVLLVEGFAFLWLLVFGLNEQRWKEQANAARASIGTWKKPTTTDLGALQRSVEEETTNLL